MDLAGYSRLSMEEQARRTALLHQIVRSTGEFQRADTAGELMPLDTGDGMALVFARDPIAPLQCAIEIAEAVSDRPELPLRLGLHSGPVTRVTDISGRENARGGGVNLAQRVMDLGEPGHILISGSAAEVLLQFDRWAPHLTFHGEAEVKHGQRLSVYGFSDGKVGMRAKPSKLGGSSPPSPPTAIGKVTLLYKRNSPQDEHLVRRIETGLTECGYEVFLDKHMAIGAEWARQIEDKIKSADAVIPLVSEATLRSEMVEYELMTAAETSQINGGRPRILPVRVAYTGPLTPTFGAVLDRLNYVLWTGEHDDDRIISELDRSLQSPSTPAPEIPKLEPVGGAVPLDSKFYVVRPTDDHFLSAVQRRDSIVLVKGARQMGKTSLLARGLYLARQNGSRVALSDFQSLNSVHLESPDTLYRALGEMLADQLDLEVWPEEAWDARRGPNMNLERYVKRFVLEDGNKPLVWAMDEVDRLFTCPFGSEVFGLFRSWHNRRSLEPDGPWAQLTLAIAYATEAHLFITDLNQSPFNVGTRIALGDFDLPQVVELNERHGDPLRSLNEVERFYALVSGQPYMVRKGLEEIVSRPLTIDQFEAEADREEGLFSDHLRRILITLSKDPALAERVRDVLKDHAVPEESFYRLRSAGVMAGESAASGRIRCEIYRRYLARHLLVG
ncbi:MAG: hypothetical protein HONBIEJF_01843 [Fimbriimonadaceae bacterium]|nr:hypothetical protein [Fimbriimonadaceae bacterium]